MTKIIGKIGLTPKGDYDKTKSYEILDLVQYEGSSYVSLINNNLTDVASDSWQLIAQKGNKGEQGIQGIQGTQGAQGDKGEQGNAFVYEDFTSEQLLNLKGEKGEKGDTGVEGKQGERGIQGEKGNNGTNASNVTFTDKTEFINYKPKDTETAYYYGVDE